ncbi:2'-5' RNA ligase family protein [Streptomyces sp. SID6673]|nr:2'-5' RNA ligase family protein [Streptomyces sp. SID11726]NDZ94592.1 2'-5' RNA ligase family protein [Streptomyces sp. SID11726]NEB25790.1 2'-5' RNA ligase family protein [Streptomyces sp. SID6673]NED60992.1 2'-5' RNA ligase family protein [Streptomyces sp. SID10244]
MVHSLELLLDEVSDQYIRDEWHTLDSAGLPNQSTIRSGTNRPHVTLAAAKHIAGSADAALTPVSLRLPFTATIGAPILFAQGSRVTLARLVVPSTELLSIHAQTIRLVADHLVADQLSDSHPGDSHPGETGPAMMPHSTPGRWTPHVTLARRLDPEQLTRALGALDTRATIDGSFVGLRHWDGDAKTEHVLGGRAC